MGISERIRQIAEYKKLSISALEKELGLKPTNLKKALQRDSDIGSEILGTIVSVYPEFSLAWLVTDEGEMLKSENEDDKKQSNMEGENDYKSPQPPDLATMLHNAIEADKIRAEADRIDKLAKLEQSATIKNLTDLLGTTTRGVNEEIGSVANNHHALLQLCASHFAKLQNVDKETILSEYRTGVASEVQREQNRGSDVVDKQN